MKPRFLLPFVLLGAPLAGQSQLDVKTMAPPPPRIDADHKTPAPPVPSKPKAGPPGATSLVPTRPAAAKSAASGTAAVRRVPEDTVVVDHPGDGRIWARGSSYKASFDGAGATYIPFLGSDAPRNYPVTFTLRGVRVGSETVDFKADGAATVAGHRVSIERGSLVETYDLASRSMEQSFVFKALPQGGDLIVEIAVTTELVPRAASDGVRFANDLGAVGYDEAFVIDADGRRERMQVTFDDGAIRLRAPAAFLATAVRPITVDPLVTTFAAGGSYVSQFGSDIAYDVSQSQYLIVWEEAFSATDHDVACVRHDRDGNQVPGSHAWIDQTSISWSHARVANLRAPHRFLVVGERGTAPGREIWGRTREAGSSLLSAQFAISAHGGNGDKLNPDVGGDAHESGPVYWTVVWERQVAGDGDIHGQQVDELGGLHGGVIPIANRYDSNDTHPSISKSNGRSPSSTQNWVVVWQNTYAPGDEDIWFARIHWNGVLTTPASVLDFNGSVATRPTVSSPTDDVQGQRYWMACYETGITPTNHDIVGSLWTGTSRITAENLSFMDGPFESSYDQITPHVDTDGSRFMVTWAEPSDIWGLDYDVRCSTYHVLYGQGLGTTEVRIGLGYTNAPEHAPRVAAARSGGARDHRYGVAWHRQQNPGDFDIHGAIYEGIGPGRVTILPTGCAGLGMSTGGGAALGDTASFHLTGVGGNAPMLIFSLPLPAAVPVCSTCALGVGLDTATFVAGADLSIPIPGEGALVGGVFAVQGLTFGVGPCLGSLTLSDTAVLRIR